MVQKIDRNSKQRVLKERFDVFANVFKKDTLQGTNISLEKENHLQKCLGRKYASFTEGKAPKGFKTHAGMQMFGNGQLQ